LAAAENSFVPAEDVYIKVNAVGLEPNVYTDPEVLRQTILYFQKCGARGSMLLRTAPRPTLRAWYFRPSGI
jgi:uncharacterized protein (DUF362 family)